ncbi:unnamed protein product [Chilo suppressalis]|uniref:Uncharacterized protein n=1 Tax=Chilo suppressalis TaxID=168631 RepID=A0ABN8B0Y1_CHISP|nr:unnamed protein product [Chilo suppressalis]
MLARCRAAAMSELRAHTPLFTTEMFEDEEVLVGNPNGRSQNILLGSKSAAGVGKLLSSAIDFLS